MAEELPESKKVYWQFRSRAAAREIRSVVFQDKIYTLGWDADGHPAFYEITNQADAATTGIQIDLNSESTFIPEAFAGIQALPWDSANPRREKAIPDMLLVTSAHEQQGKEDIPLAEVLYHIAHERAVHAGTPNYCLTMLLGEDAHILIFCGGKLHYYQKHHAENEHAVLYFLVASLRDASIPVEDAVCELLLNNPDDFLPYRNFTGYFRFLGAFSCDGIRALVGEDLPPDPLMLYFLAKTPSCA